MPEDIAEEIIDEIPVKELVTVLDNIGDRLQVLEYAEIEAKKVKREEKDNIDQRFREMMAQIEIMKQRIKELEKRPVGEQVKEEVKEEPPVPTEEDLGPSEESVQSVMRIFKKSWERDR